MMVISKGYTKHGGHIFIVNGNEKWYGHIRISFRSFEMHRKINRHPAFRCVNLRFRVFAISKASTEPEAQNPGLMNNKNKINKQ